MVHVLARLDVELAAVAAISAPRDPREVDRTIARVQTGTTQTGERHGTKTRFHPDPEIRP
jgi:hypothetical protein